MVSFYRPGTKPQAAQSFIVRRSSQRLGELIADSRIDPVLRDQALEAMYFIEAAAYARDHCKTHLQDMIRIRAALEYARNEADQSTNAKLSSLCGHLS